MISISYTRPRLASTSTTAETVCLKETGEQVFMGSDRRPDDGDEQDDVDSSCCLFRLTYRQYTDGVAIEMSYFSLHICLHALLPLLERSAVGRPARPRTPLSCRGEHRLLGGW